MTDFGADEINSNYAGHQFKAQLGHVYSLNASD